MTMAMVLSSSASAEEDGYHGHNKNDDHVQLMEMENVLVDDGGRHDSSGRYRRARHRRRLHHHHHHHGRLDEHHHVVVDGRGGGLGLGGGATCSSRNDGVDADLERFKRETDAAICDLVNGLGSCTRSSCIEEDTDHCIATQTMAADNNNKETIDGGSNDELRKYIDKYRHIKTVPSFDGCTEQHKQQLMMMMMIRQKMVRHPLPTVHETSFEDTKSFLSLVQSSSSSSSSSSSRDASAVGCSDRGEDEEGSQITINDISVTVSMILNETAEDDDDDAFVMQQSFEKPPIRSRNKAKMEKVDTAAVANNTPVSVMAANEVLMTAAKAFVAKNHKHKCNGDGDEDGSFQQQASLPMKKNGDGVDTHLEGDSESASGSTNDARDPILETNDAIIAAVNAFIDKEKPFFEDNIDEHPDKNNVPVIEIAYTTNGLMNTVEVVVPSKSIDCCCEADNIANDESCCTTTLIEEEEDEEEEDSPVVGTESMEDQILVDDIQQSYCCSSILGVPSCSS